MVVGAILLGCGIFLFFRQRARIAQSLLAEGVVIELLRQRAQGEYLRVKTAQGMKTEKKYLHLFFGFFMLGMSMMILIIQ